MSGRVRGRVWKKRWTRVEETEIERWTRVEERWTRVEERWTRVEETEIDPWKKIQS
jgi:hypothetical protein